MDHRVRAVTLQDGVDSALVRDVGLGQVRRHDLKFRKLEIDDDVIECLVNSGANPEHGARPIRRAVGTLIEDPLADEILRGTFHGCSKIHVAMADGKPAFFPENE